MKTIIVPTDFSENATNALYYAAGIARQVGGNIIMVHVINLPVMPVKPGMVTQPIAQLEEACKKELFQLSKELRLEEGFGVKVETYCLYGYSLTVLNEFIITEGIDLVVMGTRGATNFLDQLVGTNTAEFIKVAKCPVMAIPAEAKFTGLKHMAYASDFISEETVFLQQLFWLAQSFQAKVSIINILPEHKVNNIPDTQPIRNITEHFPGNNYSIAQIRENDVVEGLHKFVQDNKADVLAISIHDRSFLEDLFHQSISKQLVYHLWLPLLVLPEKPYPNLLSRINRPEQKTSAGK